MVLWCNCCASRSHVEDGESVEAQRRLDDEHAGAQHDGSAAMPPHCRTPLMRFQTALSFHNPGENDSDYASCASDPYEDHPVQPMLFLRRMSRSMSTLSTKIESLPPAPLRATEELIGSGELGQVGSSGGVDPAAAESDATVNVIKTASSMLPNLKMTASQLAWCTPDHVKIYLRARDGDIRKAAEILAKTLLWRERYKDVLLGLRLPCWQGDMRILTRSDSGHPLIYFCMINQRRFPASTATIEHMALVLEAAVQAMRNEATTFDFVADMHGFRLMSNLDPRPTISLMEMLRQPFRDRLRTGIIVDAPKSFAALWNIAYPLVSETTRKKIRFCTHSEAVRQLIDIVGTGPGQVVQDVMAGNRTNSFSVPWRQPSELTQ